MDRDGLEFLALTKASLNIENFWDFLNFVTVLLVFGATELHIVYCMASVRAVVSVQTTSLFARV